MKHIVLTKSIADEWQTIAETENFADARLVADAMSFLSRFNRTNLKVRIAEVQFTAEHKNHPQQ